MATIVYVHLLGIDCGDPGMPMNGTVTSNDTYVTSVVEFICDFGFELIGDSQRVCQPDGTWSNMVPRCRCKLHCRILILFNALLSCINDWIH